MSTEFNVRRPLKDEPRRKDGTLLSDIYDGMMDTITDGEHTRKKSEELAALWRSQGFLATVGIPLPPVEVPQHRTILAQTHDHKAVYVRLLYNTTGRYDLNRPLDSENIIDVINRGGIYLRATKNEITVHNYQQDTTEKGRAAAAQALVSHAKASWDGRMEVFGDESFKRRVWHEAQKQGVHIANYKPAPLRDPHFKP